MFSCFSFMCKAINCRWSLWFCFLIFKFYCLFKMCLILILASWGLEIMTDCRIQRTANPTSHVCSLVKQIYNLIMLKFLLRPVFYFKRNIKLIDTISSLSLIVYFKGGPRLANCGRKKVFNNATGQCSDPKNVPGWWVDYLWLLLSDHYIFSETYWIEKLKDEDSDEYYYDDY